jgi:hypothetical protein
MNNQLDPNALYANAHALFAQQIEPIFRKHEITVRLVGSALYNVMVWRDIDIYIVPDRYPTSIAVRIAAVAHDLLTMNAMWSVHVKNNLELVNPEMGIPNLYMGLRYCNDRVIENSWKIDCQVFPPEVFDQKIAEVDYLVEHITDEIRPIIIAAKQKVYSQNGTMSVGASKKIYDLVIEGGVRDVGEVVERVR